MFLYLQFIYMLPTFLNKKRGVNFPTVPSEAGTRIPKHERIEEKNTPLGGVHPIQQKVMFCKFLV